MDLEKIEVEVNNEKKELYSLLEITKENKLYLIYTDTNKPVKIKDNIYVGEIKNNTILPVSSELLEPFENLTNKIINEINNKN